MNKTLTIEVGGEMRTLDFSRSGLFEHIEDATGQDPFEWLESLKPKESNGMFKFVTEIKTLAVFVYAGVNSQLDVENKPNVDFPTVRRWVRALPTEKFSEVLTAFYEAYSDGGTKVEPGEQQAPALN